VRFQVFLTALSDSTAPLVNHSVPVPLTTINLETWSVLDMILSALAILGLTILLFVMMRRYFHFHSVSPEDAAESGEVHRAGPIPATGSLPAFRHWLPWLAVAVAAALASLFFFTSTQDPRGVMVLSDVWSLVFVPLFMVQAVASILTIRGSSPRVGQRPLDLLSAALQRDQRVDGSEIGDSRPPVPTRLEIRLDELGRSDSDDQRSDL